MTQVNLRFLTRWASLFCFTWSLTTADIWHCYQPSLPADTKNQTNTKTSLRPTREIPRKTWSFLLPFAIICSSRKKNLWLLTYNDISRKKLKRETDRKRGEKSETTITQCQKDSEVIVLQRMSSFPTCSVKYLPNYLLILTRRSLLIIWPAFTSYYFYWPDGVSLVILWRLSCPEFSNCRMPNRIFAAEWSLVLQTTFVPYHKVS